MTMAGHWTLHPIATSMIPRIIESSHWLTLIDADADSLIEHWTLNNWFDCVEGVAWFTTTVTATPSVACRSSSTSFLTSGSATADILTAVIPSFYSLAIQSVCVAIATRQCPACPVCTRWFAPTSFAFQSLHSSLKWINSAFEMTGSCKKR